MASVRLRASKGVRQTRSCVSPSSRRGRVAASTVHPPNTRGRRATTLEARRSSSCAGLPTGKRWSCLYDTVGRHWDAAQRYARTRISNMRMPPWRRERCWLGSVSLAALRDKERLEYWNDVSESYQPPGTRRFVGSRHVNRSPQYAATDV